MKYTLMHKQTAVADIEIDDAACLIRKIGTVYAPEHFPVGILVKNGIADRKGLNDWWADRSIPNSRSGIGAALEELKLSDTKQLLIHCYGLSLSDQYWICPEKSGLKWEKINFFENKFSDDIGDVLFGAAGNANSINFSSPDNTSDGNLKKRWKIAGGKRCLIKGGSNPFHQQPFNEVIASGIMERLGIFHIPYKLIWNEGVPYSLCEDFVTGDTDLIPAWRIICSQRKNNSTSVYQHFVNCCDTFGIKGVVPFLDRMIVLDYIIANEDRHLNNFGALRDAENLKWLGMAPVYDSGSSLGYDKMPAHILSEKDVVCKPFKNHHEKQLELVSSFDWIDFDRLNDVSILIEETLSLKGAENFIDEKRINAIIKSVQRRIDNLWQIAKKQPLKAGITTDDDVTENIAADYGQKRRN